MTVEIDIRRLKGSLDQTKTGAEYLALCIAQVFCERDPSLLNDFRKTLEKAYQTLEQQGNHEAAAMVGVFGRALVDPTFKQTF